MLGRQRKWGRKEAQSNAGNGTESGSLSLTVGYRLAVDTALAPHGGRNVKKGRCRPQHHECKLSENLGQPLNICVIFDFKKRFVFYIRKRWGKKI